MQKVDNILIENQLADGSNLFGIDEAGGVIEMGEIVVDLRIGRTIGHTATGAQYTLGFVVSYEQGEAFAAFGLNGVADIIAPATAFTFVGGAKNEQ